MLRTAFRIARRDLRGSRFKFGTVVVAIGLGVAPLGGLRGAAYSLRAAVSHNLREWIAGDLSVRSQNPVEVEQTALLESFAARGVRYTTVVDTIAQVSSDRVPDPQIAAAKLVDPDVYPFYGSIELAPAGDLRNVLTADAAVVTHDLLAHLQVAIGDSIQVNGVAVRIAAVILSEPDQLAELPTPVPRILVHTRGQAAEALRPRGMYYRTVLALPPGMPVGPVRELLDQAFPGRRILDYRSPDPQVLWFIERATAVLSVIGLLVLLLAVIGAAVAMWAHLEPRLDSVAAMKALGGGSRTVAAVLLAEMAILAAAGCSAGIGGALVIESIAGRWIPRLFHLVIPASWNWGSPIVSAVAGFAAAMLIPLPVLLRAMRVRPNRILRRHVSEDEGAATWKPRIAGRSLAVRHGIANVLRPGSYTKVVFGALTAAVALLFAIHTVKRQLIADLAENLRPDSGTMFLAGVLANQAGEVAQTLARQPGVEEPPVIAPFFPLAIGSSEAHGRWLSTKLDRLPRMVRVMEGSWPSAAERIEVLLPRRLARAIGAQVGSRVQFDTGGQRLEATVAALATLAPLDTLRCCLIFNRALPDQPRAVYYGVAAVERGSVPAARIALYHAFPSVTTWDASDAGQTLEVWLDGLLWIVRAAAGFAMAMGAAMVSAAVAATERRRIREIGTLKSLGATRARIIAMYCAEFSIIGAAAGITGTVLAWLATVLLWREIFGGPLALPDWTLPIAIIATIAVANIGGWTAAIRYFRMRPLEILRGE
jgi:putative ABC transport system permease protein